MSIRVAIVEDNPDIRTSLSLLIAGTPGFECVTACASGEEAMRVLPALAPDITLMDIDLPKMTGIECMRSLLASGFRGKFMMLTVLLDDASIFKALQAGANAYILKNTPPAELMNNIAELHAGGAPMTSQIARRVLESFHDASLHPQNNATSQARAQYPPHNEGAILRQTLTAGLTEREEEILQMLAEGLRYKAIAEKFFISPATVRTHIHNIYQKLHVSSRGEAVAKLHRK
jgi:DNA-binding NarL/FixJ family response regulator